MEGSTPASAIVIGGGLAGMAAAVALEGAGWRVDLFEARPFLGGRAASYPLPGTENEQIDNCQHVLLGCFTCLLDFYRRLGVAEHIQFYDRYCFIEPGGRRSWLCAGPLPAPLQFTGSFLRLAFLDGDDKLSIARGLAALRRERNRADLDSISMLDWLREHRQTPRAISRFWNQVLVSAVNEELDRMAASHGFQVLLLGFLGSRQDSRMATSRLPLSQLYNSEYWRSRPGLQVHLRAPVERIVVEEGEVRGVLVEGRLETAGQYICAVPFERLAAVAPGLVPEAAGFEHSPITGIHLWFDRPVMDVPHATLLDRTIQWVFNKRDGCYVQLVVSASRSLVEMGRSEVIELAVRELAEFLPEVRQARLEKAHVVKEVRATFSALPGLQRPPARTAVRNLFLAGDWTRTGWPATMEGAVRSGYQAAAAVAKPDARFLG